MFFLHIGRNMRQLVSVFKIRMVKEVLNDLSNVPSARGSCNGHRSAHDYEDAVRTLNSLQTNASVLDKVKALGFRTQSRNVEDTKKYLSRAGISLDDLDKLSIIHVSGTKGKGSTCALCESILRHHGYRTGFYSSPHLVAVRERIRINGIPLSKQQFTKYFFDVYGKLDSQKEHKDDMPPYFKFLTIMAFSVFLAENVNVAVVEVGLGGAFDCTNVVRHPAVVGITSLGIDHTSILGDTLEEIAWQKAGIMKPGVPAFTVTEQQNEATEVLEQRAQEIGCDLYVAPPLDARVFEETESSSFSVHVQQVNASLAVQLANFWMRSHLEGKARNMMSKVLNASENGEGVKVPYAEPCQITKNMLSGLSMCSWPGRTQILKSGPFVYFLDGAHTPESIEVCVQWYRDAASAMKRESKNNSVYSVLVFNSTRERDSALLLTPLMQCGFDLVIFCPNVITSTVNSHSDHANFTESLAGQLLKCERNKELVIQMLRSSEHLPKKKPSVFLFPCIQDALSFITQGRHEGVPLPQERSFPTPPEDLCHAQKIHVLVAGSLHLVGNVLSIIDPDLSISNCHVIDKTACDTSKPKLGEKQQASY